MALSACGGVKTQSSNASSTGPIVLGASLPLSGDLAGFGNFQKWGYAHAVEEANAAGGIEINGKKRKVKLKILDDKSDPNQVTANTESLVSDEKAVALLGSCTPALVAPGSIVAERSKVPFVTGCSPEGAFTSVKDKFTYAWDIFFAEPDLAAAPFAALEEAGVETNKKVAILHDNGPDGKVVGGQLWPALAKKAGYEVVVNEEFPTQNTDFGAAVQKVKSSGADVLLVDAVTPQAVSIRKQLKTVGYTPKVIDIEKGAEPQQFAEALGDLADGVLVGGYWDPSFDYKGSKELAEAYTTEVGPGLSQHIADSYTAAKVLTDAITAAGSTEAGDINTAIGKTDGEYPVGPVKFGDNHVAVLPVTLLQWNKGKTQVVWPAESKTADLLFPAP
jgi:branched-chain amino acid transport system substrate-binding protein